MATEQSMINRLDFRLFLLGIFTKASKSLNDSGVSPVEYKVLVKPSDFEVDPVFKRAAESGLKLPTEVVERELAGQIVAELIAVGGNAFMDWKPPIPAVGNRVLIAKYAGITVKGADGVEYRMLNDKDISGIITKDGVSRI